MANLTADRPYRTQGQTRCVRVALTTGVTYYRGGLIAFTAAGGLGIKPTDVANQGSTVGILTKGKVAVSGDNYGEVEIGTVFIPFSSAAQADVGDYAYATDDSTVAKSATNSDPIGIIEDVEVGVGLWINLDRGIVKTALA